MIVDVCPRVDRLSRSAAKQMAIQLLNEARLITIPGSSFSQKNQGYLSKNLNNFIDAPVFIWDVTSVKRRCK